MKYLISLLDEPSTWRGLVLIATAAGWKLSPEQADAIVPFGLGLAGMIGAFTRDKA